MLAEEQRPAKPAFDHQTGNPSWRGHDRRGFQLQRRPAHGVRPDERQALRPVDRLPNALGACSPVAPPGGVSSLMIEGRLCRPLRFCLHRRCRPSDHAEAATSSRIRAGSAGRLLATLWLQSSSCYLQAGEPAACLAARQKGGVAPVILWRPGGLDVAPAKAELVQRLGHISATVPLVRRFSRQLAYVKCICPKMTLRGVNSQPSKAYEDVNFS